MSLARPWSVAGVLLAFAVPAAVPLAHATTIGPHPDQAQEPAREDLLTYARGVLFVSQSGLASGSAGTALLAIDGDAYRMGLMNDRTGPVEFVYELPTETRFDRFAIPQVPEPPGNTTFVREVVVSGSAEGPDAGFEELVRFELETPSTDDAVAEAIPETTPLVRWLRVRFEGGIEIRPGEEGRTVIRFTELVGNGTEEVPETSTAFDGLWELRLTERLDMTGVPFELYQDGATVTGCYGTLAFQGTVNGRVARVSGTETDTGRPGAMIIVAARDGSLHASVSINGSQFGARTAVAVAGVEAPCGRAPPLPRTCGTDVYVNFEFDSAVLRPESAPVLADVYRRLLEEGADRIDIVGHTSTEGSEEYNLALSRRRAQAVVDDLVARGFDAGRITASGAGEGSPLISPDDEETAREINRRVQITCS